MTDHQHHCSSCGRFDGRECPEKPQAQGICNRFISWSDHWAKEMVAIERALNNTYIAAACLVLLAAVTVIIPTAMAAMN